MLSRDTAKDNIPEECIVCFVWLKGCPRSDNARVERKLSTSEDQVQERSAQLMSKFKCHLSRQFAMVSLDVFLPLAIKVRARCYPVSVSEHHGLK